METPWESDFLRSFFFNSLTEKSFSYKIRIYLNLKRQREGKALWRMGNIG